MDHPDWIGISVLIGTITSSVVSLLAAIQALRNHELIRKVGHKVNGVTERLVSQAHESGRQEAIIERIQAEGSGIIKK